MSEKAELITDTEVVSIKEEDKIVINHITFKVSELIKEAVKKIIGDEKLRNKWSIDGVDCEVLSPNKNWRKGKVKICLAFIPDEIESPLDDIRQNM